MRKVSHSLLAALLICGLSPAPAWAWGASGHRMIGRLAIKSLPAQLPVFLRSADMVWAVGELAREPDRWRRAGTAHDEAENPGHFVNVGEDGKIAGAVSLNALPATRDDYDTALRTGGSTQYKSGFLPYSIIVGFQQLRMDLGYWRVDVAGEKFAKNGPARAWFAADRKLHEALVRRDLGVWSHYVGDASQPMHVSVHHDGWGDFPNPENMIVTAGLHGKFEGAFVRAYAKNTDVAAHLPAPRDCACKIEDETMAYLGRTLAEVLPVYRLDKEGAFDRNTPQGKAFVAERLAAGTAELRDLIVEAWRQSDTITVGYPETAVKDVEAGKVDALKPLQGLD